MMLELFVTYLVYKYVKEGMSPDEALAEAWEVAKDLL